MNSVTDGSSSTFSTVNVKCQRLLKIFAEVIFSGFSGNSENSTSIHDSTKYITKVLEWHDLFK